jgi:ribonuclease P protein subunit RPR2
MMRKNRKKPRWQNDSAAERIEALFAMAAREAAARPDRARRYAGLAIKIGMRYNIRLPAELKRRVCRSCGSYLAAGGRRVRISGGRRTVTCLNCGAVARYPLEGRRKR